MSESTKLLPRKEANQRISGRRSDRIDEVNGDSVRVSSIFRNSVGVREEILSFLPTAKLVECYSRALLTRRNMDFAGPSSAAASSNNVEQTVPILLTTSLSQYAIPQGPYMVPVSWKRTHLSTLVNKLVSASENEALPGTGAVPFDFIIDAEILRSSLNDYLDSQSLTSESTLTIEYVRSTLPPSYTAAFEQDDWISSVDCSHPSSSLFLTSSYDGSVRLFSASMPDEAVMTLRTQTKASAWSGANASLTAAKWAPNHMSLATAGMDGKVSMWNVTEQGDEWQCGRKWSGEAHNGPVSALDVCQGPSSTSILSGGWEGMIALWDDVDTPIDGQDSGDEDDSEESEEEAGSKKRRKVSNGRSAKSKSTSAANKSASRMQPTMTMWHAPSTVNSVSGARNVAVPNSRVSAVSFEKSHNSGTDSNRAWSAAYNGTIKGWDLGSGGIEHTQRSMPGEPKPILCMDQLTPSNSGTTFVTGHMERSLGLWDMRETAQQVCTPIASAHSAPVSVVRCNPKNSVLFASGSHDGVVKVWDTRSPRKALFTLQQQTKRSSTAAASNGQWQDKILALDWTLDGQTVVAGGQDKKISLYRGSGMA